MYVYQQQCNILGYIFQKPDYNSSLGPLLSRENIVNEVSIPF